MSEERVIVLKKVERQLILYRYFSSQRIKEANEIFEYYGIPVSTMYKDLADLRDAGLGAFKYDKNGNMFVEVKEASEYDPKADKPTRVRHLNRLKRLAMCMDGLYNDPMTYEAVYDNPEDDEDYSIVFYRGEKSCAECYREMFPDVTARTMQRDFQTLSNIGYRISYNRILRQYDFYEAPTDVDDWWVEGVFRDETGKLCRRCSPNTDFEMQENYQEAIEGMRMGLPRDEWEPY